jgi:hypothetical protein
VPAAVADFVGSPWIELNEDVVVFAAFEDVEAAAEEFGGIEVFGFGEFFGGELGSGEAVEGEGAEVASGGVPGEEVPEVVDAGEVVWMDEAGPGAWGGAGVTFNPPPHVVAYKFVTFGPPPYVVAYKGSAFAVEEFDGFGGGDGFGDGLEGVEVGVFGRKGAKGEGGVEVLEPVAVLGVELAGEFVEGEAEGFFEWCAEVLGDGFEKRSASEIGGRGRSSAGPL